MSDYENRFIGHNFGDYKNKAVLSVLVFLVLSVTILETTKTATAVLIQAKQFYRSQFWRLQKLNQGLEFKRCKFYRSQFWRLQKPQMVSANYTIKVRSYSA